MENNKKGMFDRVNSLYFFFKRSEPKPFEYNNAELSRFEQDLKYLSSLPESDKNEALLIAIFKVNKSIEFAGNWLVNIGWLLCVIFLLHIFVVITFVLKVYITPHS